VSKDFTKHAGTPVFKCHQVACKAVQENEQAATSDGWYLDTEGHWYCHQHNPTLIKTH
jgi:hypothetical protein